MSLINNSTIKNHNWKRSLFRANNQRIQKQPTSVDIPSSLNEKVDWFRGFAKHGDSIEAKAYCNYLLTEIDQMQFPDLQNNDDWRRTRVMNIELKIDNLKNCHETVKKVRFFVTYMPQTPTHSFCPCT